MRQSHDAREEFRDRRRFITRDTVNVELQILRHADAAGVGIKPPRAVRSGVHSWSPGGYSEQGIGAPRVIGGSTGLSYARHPGGQAIMAFIKSQEILLSDIVPEPPRPNGPHHRQCL